MKYSNSWAGYDFPVSRSDVQWLVHKFPPPHLSPVKERRKEVIGLLKAYGPLLPSGCTYPVWHPIARCLAAMNKTYPAVNDKAPLQKLFAHDEMFRWAIVGWPDTPTEIVFKVISKYSDLADRIGADLSSSPTCLPSDRIPASPQLYVRPELVPVWESYTEDEWVGFLHYAIGLGFCDASVYEPQTGSHSIEPWEGMKLALFGSEEGERFHPAFTPRLIERMEPIYMRHQFRHAKQVYGWSMKEALHVAATRLGAEGLATLREALKGTPS